MSSLIDALKRITPWYQSPKHSRPSRFPYGLSSDEIEQQLTVLPFRLPLEFYEIYQWCNGSKNPEATDDYQPESSHEYNILIAEAQFFDLETAVKLWVDSDRSYGRGVGKDASLNFPLMHHENGIMVVVGSQEQQPASPVWDISFLNDSLREPEYPSVTKMMTAVAEVEEKEREFWSNSDELGYFDSKGFAKVSWEIREKYRS
jgi:hypothetical protein